jgi:hypothetical protein
MHKLAVAVGLVAALLLAGPQVAGATTDDTSNVHGCAIWMHAQSGFDMAFRPWVDGQLQSRGGEGCGGLRASLTIVTRDGQTVRTAKTTIDQDDLYPSASFVYETWAHGSFVRLVAWFSWCADGGTTCASRVSTRATMWKGGGILFG